MTRIMIVDDKENDRYMLEVLLKGYGYEVIGARNGAEALELARKDPPDVFISDIMMPVMDGFTLCRELKADKRLKTIPVIFYTATYTSQMDEELARKLGAREYIVKPQDPEVLVGKLHKIMEERVPGEYAQPPLGEEMEFFRQHNRVLFRKLEQKMAELQKAYFTALLEISRRKQAEEELRKREFELNESQRMAHIGSWDWDARTDTITWSAEYYRIYNIDPKLPTPNYLDHLKVYTPESAKKLDAAVGFTMKTGDLYELELELINPDEKRQWVFAKGEAKYDTNGKIVGLRGTAQNITQSKRAQESLKKSESMLKRTQHLAKVGGWEYDIEKKKISWSDEVYCIYGVSPEEYDPNDVKQDIQFYAPQDRMIIERAFNSAVNEGIPYDFQVRFVNARGKNLWVRTMGQVEKKDGRMVRIFGNIMDITEMKNTQEKLRTLNEELEKRVKDRTAELETKNAELEHLNHVYVGRELRMIELKKQIAELEKKNEDIKKPPQNSKEG